MFRRNNSNQLFMASGRLKKVIMFPLFMGALLILFNIGMYFVDVNCAKIASIFVLVYIIAITLLTFYIKNNLMHELIDFSSNYSQVQRQLLYDLSIPYCLIDNNGRVMWMNKMMLEKTEKKKDFRKNIATVFHEITPNIFPTGEESKEVRISYQGRDYCVEMKRISIDKFTRGVNIVSSDKCDSFVAMYMFDETDINMYIQKIKEERFVVGLIYIDNYEEALESIDDVRRSLFVGLIDKRVNKYFAAGAAIVRKLEKDKYLAVFRYKYLEKLLEDKFSILEDIKNVKVGNEMTITLSVGIGTGAGEYSKNFDIAKAAMDLALGRGGGPGCCQGCRKDNVFWWKEPADGEKYKG